METWSSWLAEVLTESVEAGFANTFDSDRRAADVSDYKNMYIVKSYPLLSPPFLVKNPGKFDVLSFTYL